MNVKVDDKILLKIKTISKLRGDQYSDFVRIAISEKLASLGYLTKKECKALGVDNN